MASLKIHLEAGIQQVGRYTWGGFLSHNGNALEGCDGID